MKVVIFCGGLGVRMGEETQRTPKPMITIGSHPILWHILRYYAAWGHDDFILCLGHKGELIKEYFLDLNPSLHPWRITFVDTGVKATIGERLKSVESYLENESTFLATYGDGLTDAPLDAMIERHEASGRIVQFLAVPPALSLHVVKADADGAVRSIVEMSNSEILINGGFFVCRRELLDHIRTGEDLVEGTMARLLERSGVGAFEYAGFFHPMDTLKDRQFLESMQESGKAPWAPPFVNSIAHV